MNSQTTPQPPTKKPSAPINKAEELADVKRQIRERRAYYNQQEKLIDKLVAEGNDTLRGLNWEIAIARQTLKDLKTDIRTGRQDYRILQEDLHVIQVHLSEASERVTVTHISGQIIDPAFG